jgi:alkanesulfonate monooxygenase SsuD/methylene tetrahydromethanopterin reductase-like flavin-dependent oxidoreductase (luciferase family)
VFLKAWREEEFSHEGKYYQYDNTTLYVKSLWRPTPPLWLAASSDDTLVRAGQGCPLHNGTHVEESFSAFPVIPRGTACLRLPCG